MLRGSRLFSSNAHKAFNDPISFVNETSSVSKNIIVLDVQVIVYSKAIFSLGHAHVVTCHVKIRKRAKIRNRYNQAPHMTQDTIGKVTTSQLDITNESQEVSPLNSIILANTCVYPARNAKYKWAAA